MKSFSKVILGAFLAAVVGLAGVALATNTGSSTNAFFGYNPSTGLFGVPGGQIALGASPTSGASTSCGTLGAITGGTTAGTVATAAVTTCTLQLVFPSPAPNGWLCDITDLTHPAQETQAATTTTSCTTSAMTITAGDVLMFQAIGY